MPSGGGWRLCGLGRLIAAAACACVLMSPRPATAAIGAPATLCRTFTPGATDVDASAASRLAEEAGRAEQALATSGESVPEFTPRSLDLPPGAPSPAARAAYCSAIGELARRGAFGNPLDAPGYLHVAFQYAEQARADALTARVAYRLGLSLTGSAVAMGGRGAQIPGEVEETYGATNDDSGATRSLASNRRRSSMLDEPHGAAACNALLAMAGYPPPGMALSCAAQLGDADTAARADLQMARLLLGRSHMMSGQSDAYRRAAGQVATHRLKVSGERTSTELRLRLAETAIDALRSGEATDPSVSDTVAALEAARAVDDVAGLRAYAAALHGRLVALRDPGAAMPYFERAIALESLRPSPLRLGDWYLLAADADPDHRAADVRSAYAALVSVRGLLPLRDPVTEESTFQLHERRVFESRIADVLQAIPTTSPGAGPMRLTPVQAGQLAGAQDILETYRQAEVSDALGNECLPTPLRVQSQQLRADEIILYPVLLPDRVEIIYLRGGGDGQFRRLQPNGNYNREKVAALVDSLRGALFARARTGWEAPSRELYDLLIKPIEGQLDPRQTLVVIPDSTLSALPFAALKAADNRYLIQKTRLVIAPGLAYAQPGSVRAGRRAFVAAGSLDHDVPLSFGTFPKLMNASSEARMAAGWVGATHVGSGYYMKDFSADDLRSVLLTHDVDVLHLATHAEFSGGTDRSFIVANGGFITLRELSTIISDSKVHGKVLDLLVLSACETAVGDDRSSLGLAGAAVQSGARGAIASLWPVDDESTKNLMFDFYAAYRGGASKAGAIQTAELKAMGLKQNPYYWASLILIGGWR